jgi:hypothetical protein
MALYPRRQSFSYVGVLINFISVTVILVAFFAFIDQFLIPYKNVSKRFMLVCLGL